jgi:hypothetical protein
LFLSASNAFSHSTTTQQNQLVADLVAAETACEGAVTGNTHENQAWLWRRFTKYLDSIGLSHDPYLEFFSQPQRNRIIRAFAMALWQGQYLGKAHDTLATGTIRNSILDLSLTFWKNGQPNPTKDKDLQLSFLLQQQVRAFKNADPKEKQQKAIPACVITKISKQRLTELHCAILQLTILAFFFAMRLCEYV